MIELEKEFVSGDGGFSTDPLTYKQLMRTKTVALYERSRDGVVKDYEVFNIKVDPKGKKIFDQVLEDDREKYPSSGVFGFSAWSFNSLGGAKARYELLVKESEAPEAEEKKDLLIPVGEFTVTELAEFNHVQYPTASLFVKESLEGQIIKFLREEQRNAKGKKSKIYTKA